MLIDILSCHIRVEEKTEQGVSILNKIGLRNKIGKLEQASVNFMHSKIQGYTKYISGILKYLEIQINNPCICLI